MADTLICAVTILVSIKIFSSHALPMPLATNFFGNPMAYRKIPPDLPYTPRHTSLMLTGFYHPSRDSVGNQAGAVYAQGSSVGGGAYLQQPQYMMFEPNSAHNPDISTADALAIPEEPRQEELEERTTQNDSELTTREPGFNNFSSTKAPVVSKQGKKIIITSDDEDYEYEEPSEDDVSASERGPPNNPGTISYFPMMFSFPKSSGGSSAGPVMAIANSYSTGKGGVASSVATAYGSYPKKKINSSPAQKSNK